MDKIMSYFKKSLSFVKALTKKIKTWYTKTSPENQTIALSAVVGIFLIASLNIAPVFQKEKQLPVLNTNIAGVSGVGEEISICITGDIMLHESQLNEALQEDGTYDFGSSFSEVDSILRRADLSIVNFNGSIVENSESYGHPYFYSPKAICQNLSDIGVDMISLCNRPSVQVGVLGMENTIHSFSESNISAVNTLNGEPLFTESNGIRLAFISVMDSENMDKKSPYCSLDKKSLRQQVMKCKENNADIVIAFVNWGEQGNSMPSDHMAEWAQYMVSLGIDVIVGNGSHIPMPICTIEASDSFDVEKTNKGYVYYSLGNFLSNQRENSGYMGCMLNFSIRKISHDETRVVSSDIIPVYTNVDTSTGENFKVVPVYEDSIAPGWMDELNKEKFYNTYDIVSTLTAYH